MNPGDFMAVTIAAIAAAVIVVVVVTRYLSASRQAVIAYLAGSISSPRSPSRTRR